MSGDDGSEAKPAAAAPTAAGLPQHEEQHSQQHQQQVEEQHGPAAYASSPDRAETESEDATSYEKRWHEMYHRLVAYKKV